MKLIFIRHGHPDYATDTLTEDGKIQAESVAKRLLKTEKIDKIYSSPMGRAMETASYTAKLYNLPITVLPFMHEITWNKLAENDDDYHPWLSARKFTSSGEKIENIPTKCIAFTTSNLDEQYEYISKEIDNLLKELGYEKSGYGYLATHDNDETVVIFSHGGSSSLAMNHLLSLPKYYLFAYSRVDYSSMCSIVFPNKKGDIATPYLSLFNENAHVEKKFLEEYTHQSK